MSAFQKRPDTGIGHKITLSSFGSQCPRFKISGRSTSASGQGIFRARKVHLQTLRQRCRTDFPLCPCYRRESPSYRLALQVVVILSPR